MRTAQSSAICVHWLIDPAAGDSVSVMRTAAQREEYPFPRELGHGWMERLPLADGLSILQSAHRFRPEVSGRLIPLGEFKFEFSETTLAMQTIQGGIACHREFHPPAELIFKPGYDLFRRADRIHAIPLLDSSSDSEMTALIASETALADLIGEDFTSGLIAALGLEPAPLVKVLPVPLHVSAPLRASVSTTLNGRLKLLFANSKALEYVCALTAHLSPEVAAPSRLGRKRDKVRELHASLACMEGKVPTLNELAMRVGMSARWLNNEFAHEYGMPIFAFIADLRLKEAHAALIGGDLPMKVVSQRMGYSHVNHFINAFKKKFGYPPGSLRRGRPDRDASARPSAKQ